MSSLDRKTSGRYLPTGSLKVTVGEAQDVTGAQINRLYAVVRFGESKKETAIVKGAGSNPIWNQLFSFDVPRSERKYNELEISLFNSHHMRRDDPLGETRLTGLGDLMADNDNRLRNQTYEIQRDGREKVRRHTAGCRFRTWATATLPQGSKARWEERFTNSRHEE